MNDGSVMVSSRLLMEMPINVRPETCLSEDGCRNGMLCRCVLDSKQNAKVDEQTLNDFRVKASQRATRVCRKLDKVFFCFFDHLMNDDVVLPPQNLLASALTINRHWLSAPCKLVGTIRSATMRAPSFPIAYCTSENERRHSAFFLRGLR